MKQWGLFLFVVLLAGSATAFAQDTSLVDDTIRAFNGRDAAYFENMLAADVVWLDEDGHAIAGKERVMGFISRQLFKEGRTFTTRNVRVFTSGDSAWAHFNYAVEEGGHPAVEGLGSAVFKKDGDTWKIAMIHGAKNVAGHH